MNIKAATVVTLIAAAMAISIPIVIAIQLSRAQGLDSEARRAQSYAADVLRRTEVTTDQIAAGTDSLARSGAGNPCSDANIALMRKIDIASTYIQAIGYTSNNKFVCSSLGLTNTDFPLPVPDLVTPNGASVRLNVEFPFAAGTKFLVVERNGYAVIVHRDLPIDATTDEADVVLAVINTDSRKILTSRGPVQAEWFGRLRDGWETTFTDDGYVVAVVRSKRWNSSAIAALPITYLDQRTRAFALILVPIGLIAGVGLGLAVLYLAKQQRAMPAVIRSALRNNEFFLAYQPVVDLKSRKWVGAEALLRWRRRNGEFVRPDIFIPIAEDTGLITRITETVIRLVSEDAHDLIRRHPDFHIAINLSAEDLHSNRSIALVNGLHKSLKGRPQNVIVEATERGFLDFDIARSVVKDFRASQIKVAIDDFGTGYSSLSYLHTFQVDFLKIDKSFVDTIGIDSATSHVVDHIIEIAKALKLEMIAEGVETEEQARYLTEHGVQYAQGYLFAKPMPMAELLGSLDAARV